MANHAPPRDCGACGATDTDGVCCNVCYCRRCPECMRWLPQSDFYNANCYCKLCLKVRSVRWNAAHPDQRRTANRQSEERRRADGRDNRVRMKVPEEDDR